MKTKPSIYMKTLMTIIFFQLLAIAMWGQKDSCWSVLVLEKGNQLKIKPDMSSYNTTGFYLYKNCVYEMDLIDKTHIGGRLIDIKMDTLFFTNYFNQNVAAKCASKLDTFSVYYKNLDKLNLIADRAMGWYTKYSLDKYEFHFKKDTINYSFESDWAKIYDNDTMKYELVAHMTQQGINLLFEQNGRTYFFYGVGMIKPDSTLIDTTYNRKNLYGIHPVRLRK